MITREQYLDALELIDQYHQQTDSSNKVLEKKTELSEWLANLPRKPSLRLYNALMGNFSNRDYKVEPYKYIEDITKYNFLRRRNAGKKTWKEFCELRELGLKEQ